MSDDKTPAGNGRVYVLDPRPPLRPAVLELPKFERATWEDLARGYATISTNDYQHKQAQYRELDEMRLAIVQLDSNMSRLKDEVKEAIVEVMLQRPATPFIPPMRPQMPSTTERAQRVAVGVRERFVKESQSPESPDPTPDDLQRMIAEGVSKELAAQK